jgi:hypothetical protein
LQLLIFLLLPWLLFTSVPETTIIDENSLGNRIALSFVGPGSFVPTEEQLSFAETVGIDLLEISDPSQIGHLPADRFFLLFDANLKFLTPHRLLNEKDAIAGQVLENIRMITNHYPNRIAAVNLFRYPDDQSERFSQAASLIADSIRHQIDLPLYYQSGFPVPGEVPGGFDFTANRLQAETALPESPSQVVFFDPSDQSGESLAALAQILNRSLEFDESIVIIPGGWFFSVTESNPDLAVIFSDYFDGQDVHFPLPAEENSLPPLNWSVLILLVIWISIAVHNRYQPIYLPVISRYFFNHTFFVADVMQGRFRSMPAGIILMSLHCVITGLFLFTVGQSALSPAGREVLANYFPGIILNGYELASLFVIGILAGLLLKSISLSWIYILNKEIKNFIQVINLYSWPLILNLILVSSIVYLAVLEVNQGWIYGFSVLFLLVWFMSFNAAAIAGARYLEKNRILNIFLTVGIHLIVITSILLFVLFTPEFLEPFLLAVSIP